MPKNDIGLSAWLYDMLSAYNIKQIKFAEMCGVHRSAVHHWLNNKRLPQRHTLSAIADALATITGEHTDDIKAELLWQVQMSIESKETEE